MAATMSLRRLFNAGRSDARTCPQEFLESFHSTCFRDIPLDLLDYSKKALIHGNYFIRMYAIMCWIVFSDSAKLLVSKYENPIAMERFHRILTQALLFNLHGLKPNGKTFEVDDKSLLVMRRQEFFVYNMMCVYTHL